MILSEIPVSLKYIKPNCYTTASGTFSQDLLRLHNPGLWSLILVQNKPFKIYFGKIVVSSSLDRKKKWLRIGGHKDFKTKKLSIWLPCVRYIFLNIYTHMLTYIS